MSNADTGAWGELKDWPLIGLHAIVMQDGRVLSFGTDSQGMQGGQFIYSVWDPVTNEHTILENTTATDIFCSAAIILPGTDQIIIGGGDDRTSGNVNAGVDDVNFFSTSDLGLTQTTLGAMNFERWYPTMISLPTGQTVILGGTNSDRQGIPTPEIFTPGEGWRMLDGANDTDLAISNSYPRAFVNADGNIVYFAGGNGNTGKVEVRLLDPSGQGTVTQIGELPFNHSWSTPAIMFETGKILISATNGDMWVMDINGDAPQFTQTESLSQVRNWSDLTVMADGKILVNGGTSGNNNQENGADKTAAVWNPATGEWTYMVDEDNPRLYHSGSVLLTDGTILSLGGGAAGSAENNYIDAQIYKPTYLYDENGDLAERPVVTGTPDELVPGETFSITVDDASAISKITLVKNGAATHSFNMEARMINLDFIQGEGETLEIKLPSNANEVTAGSWMLFVFDEDGVPAIAPVIAVNPMMPKYDGIGDLKVDYFALDGQTTSLDNIDFEADSIYSDTLLEIDEGSTTGSFYEGGLTNSFAAQYLGQFSVTQSGDYTFFLTSDDGSRLFIDGELIVDHDGLSNASTINGNATLSEGVHHIEIRYFENFGSARLDLDWSGPGFTRSQMRFDGAEENLLVNGGLEKSQAPAGQIQYFDDLAGWQTSNTVELWSNGTNGMDAASGERFAEIDAVNGVLSQSVSTFEDGAYDVSFEFAGRPGSIASSKFDVLWNGEIFATITPANSVWTTATVQVIGTGGDDVLAFSAVAGDTDSVGALLDSVRLVAVGLPDVQPPEEFDNIINGTTETDFLQGTDLRDDMNGKEGVDVLYGSAGDDRLNGGDSGYNQANYAGVAADYTVTKNVDGSFTLASAAYGTDTLINIEAIVFEGEDKWYTLESLAGSTGQGETINGTEDADVLIGTSGDDIINGFGGNDGFQGTGGSDLIDGGGSEYDQVDYEGNSSDYSFAHNEDGTVAVSKPNGETDILTEIDGIWFAGDNFWSLLVDLLPAPLGETIDGTSGNDFLEGTSGDDTINAGEGVDVIFGSKGNDTISGGDGGYNQVNYAGNAADYVFASNADGSFTVTSDDFGTDILTDISGIVFEGEDMWYGIDDLIV